MLIGKKFIKIKNATKMSFLGNGKQPCLAVAFLDVGF